MSGPTMSKSTFRGTLVFLVLLVAVFVLPDVLMSFQPDDPVHISYMDDHFQKGAADVKRNGSRRDEYHGRKSRFHVPPSAFDPNTYTLEDWMALGLSEKQAAVILKFGKRGIRSDEDLKRIFVISDELYALIEDSTFYAVAADRNVLTAASPVKKEAMKISINTATEEELLKIKGIGPFFARQIIRRRDELGGFYTESQLLEVWKMDAEKLAVIQPSITIDLPGLKRVPINRATAEELAAHPYISWNLANSIVKLRSQNGPYKSVEGIKKSVLVTDELFEKLQHYLTIDE